MVNELTQKLETEVIVNSLLSAIDREREREIISKRFGLFDRKETLEQIGESLGITRERVRQLEKAVINKLKASAENNQIPDIDELQSTLIKALEDNGKVTRVFILSEKLTTENSKLDQSRIAFIATLCPKLSMIDENDHFFQSVSITDPLSVTSVKKKVGELVSVIKDIGSPSKIEDIANKAGFEVDQSQGLATTSKDLATLNGRWGLLKWPEVNPKNIRDKIYVILKESGKQMHFNEISDAIKSSDFKRKNVTTQAIHNELIKDKRFVLIGRGIYALKEWGYKKGTVSEVITDVLLKAGEPLHRDEIIKQVLKSRHVKETTVLLNLQNKDKYKRVSKGTYTLLEQQ